MPPLLHSHASVPVGMRTPRLQLQPLRATDVDRDYEAVMESAEQLRRWGQTEWPAADFTRAENLADLERHEREHREGVAFTYTVLDPAGVRCLGCVYLSPPAPAVAALIAGAERVVSVGFWARTAELAGELDAHLLEALREWLATEWRFDRVLFTISREDARQDSLLRAAGLEHLGSCVVSGGRERSVFAEPRRA